MKKSRSWLPVILFLLISLTACGNPPSWEVVPETASCTPATVLEKDWNDGDRRDFILLLQTEDGEIGMAYITAYEYVPLQIGDTVCIVQ